MSETTTQEPITELDLIPSSDRELWYITSVDDSWSLPVYADPFTIKGQEFYLVQPALALIKRQLTALLDVIERHHSGMSDDGSYKMWFLKSVWESIAKKAPGITPKYYYKWDNKTDVGRKTAHVAQFSPATDGVTAEQEKFIDFIVSKYALLDKQQVKHFFRAFVYFGVEWLGYYHKPINFGLFRIEPIPYRANWKEAIYSTEADLVKKRVGHDVPRTWLARMRDNEIKRKDWVDEHRPLMMMDAKLLDVDWVEHFCHWHLELIEDEQWTAKITEYESEARKLKGPGTYAAHIVRCIQKTETAILRALSAWVKKISKPCGSLEPCRGASGQCIVPFKGFNHLLKIGPKHSLLPVVVDDDKMLVEANATPPVEAPVEVVRKVPNLLAETGNMRESGEALGEPDHGGMGVNGVQLPYGSEGADAGSTVLDGGSNER